MKLLILVLAGAVTACTTVEERTVPVEVKVPIPVTCVHPGDVPPVVPNAATVLKKGDSPGEKIRAILVEREQLRQAEGVLRILVQACLVE